MAPVMSICKVLEIILSGLGHFAAIKCPYKSQLIGSNVWFPIFLSICVSPVIRDPKCSVHQSAQSDFSLKTERKRDSSLQQIAKWKRPSNSISCMGPCAEIYETYNDIPHFFPIGVNSSFSPLLCVVVHTFITCSLISKTAIYWASLLCWHKP